MNTLNNSRPDTTFGVSNLSAGTARYELQKQWLYRDPEERFLNLSEMKAYLSTLAEVSTAEVITTRKVDILAPDDPRSVEDTRRLWLETPSHDGPIAFSHYSFGELASRAKAPARYLRTLPAQLAAPALQYGLRYTREVEEIGIYYREDEPQLRAVTGPKYGRILDRDVVTAVMSIAGNGTGDARWKVPGTLDWSTRRYNPETPVTKDTTTLFASDRDVWIFLVDDRNPIQIGTAANGEPDLVFRGFYVWNSEVGARTLGIATFLLRALCGNRIMWGVEDFQEIRIRHTVSAPDRWVDEARPALEAYAESSSAGILGKVEEVKKAKIADDDAEAVAFLRGLGHSAKRAEAIAETHLEEEGKPIRTRWDVAQGLTAFARGVTHTDDRVAIEREAGKVLSGSRRIA